MALIAKESADFKPVPAGTHVAICYRIVDIGTQHSEFQGRASDRHQVVISWELPNELMDDGRPFSVSKFYTVSLDKKSNLRKDLEAWRNRPFTPEELQGFELKKILGKGCMISIVAREDGQGTKAGAVMALPKGTQTNGSNNDLVLFDMDVVDMSIYQNLPDWIKEKIAASKEGANFMRMMADAHVGDGAIDGPPDYHQGIPF